MIDYSKFIKNSRKWLSEYIEDNCLESIVIGVSGGIDSTCSLAIAFPVCEELNIPLIGRSLPTTTNQYKEKAIARLVGEAFCSDFKTVNISEECEKIISSMQLTEGDMTNLQKGNIKARYRMMYLRNLASLHKGIVLDNDNFTEWNLGFWTVGGDSPGDINLGLHYLWKTEIYELAKYLYDEYVIDGDSTQSDAIAKSVNLTPTDGNGVSKSDCEQFGLDNYEQVDDVLKTMYYQESPREIEYSVKNGKFEIIDPNGYIRLIDSYNEQGVDKVMMLHQNTMFKRITPPIMPSERYLKQ